MCMQENNNMEGLINSIVHPHLEAFWPLRLKYCVTEENEAICSPFHPLCPSGLRIIDCAFSLDKEEKIELILVYLVFMEIVLKQRFGFWFCL